MPDAVVLDTDIDSRLPEPELTVWAQAWLAANRRLFVTAPTVIERRYGYQTHFRDWERHWSTYSELHEEGTIGVLPLGFQAAEIAGHLRAVCPHPPRGRPRGRKSKAQHRVSWILDILIAATAASHAVPLFTSNGADHQHLGRNMPAPYRLELIVYPVLP